METHSEPSGGKSKAFAEIEAVRREIAELAQALRYKSSEPDPGEQRLALLVRLERWDARLESALTVLLLR